MLFPTLVITMDFFASLITVSAVFNETASFTFTGEFIFDALALFCDFLTSSNFDFVIAVC